MRQLGCWATPASEVMNASVWEGPHQIARRVASLECDTKAAPDRLGIDCLAKGRVL